MSALPPKADLLGRHEKRLLMTQSGHSMDLAESRHVNVWRNEVEAFGMVAR